MQFRLIRHLHPENQHNYRLHRTWFLASWVSWGLGFLCIFFGNGMLLTLLLLAAIGTALKGLFLMSYLGISVRGVMPLSAAIAQSAAHTASRR